MLPKISPGKSSTRELIIDVLSDKWPLSIKEIYNTTNRKFKNMTYQAVHKTAKQLVEDGVLEKTNKKYQLSASWIDKLKKVSTHLDMKYKGFADFDILKKDHFTLTFSRIYDYYTFIIGAVNQDCFDKVGGVGVFDHPPWPYVGAQNEIDNFRKVCGILKPTVLIKGKRQLDHYAGKFYSEVGCKVYYGVRNISGHTYILDDSVFTIVFSKETSKTIDKIYSLSLPQLQKRMTSIIDNIYNKPADITLTFIRNQKFADSLREKYMEYID